MENLEDRPERLIEKYLIFRDRLKKYYEANNYTLKP